MKNFLLLSLFLIWGTLSLDASTLVGDENPFSKGVAANVKVYEDAKGIPLEYSPFCRVMNYLDAQFEAAQTPEEKMDILLKAVNRTKIWALKFADEIVENNLTDFEGLKEKEPGAWWYGNVLCLPIIAVGIADERLPKYLTFLEEQNFDMNDFRLRCQGYRQVYNLLHLSLDAVLFNYKLEGGETLDSWDYTLIDQRLKNAGWLLNKDMDKEFKGKSNQEERALIQKNPGGEDYNAFERLFHYTNPVLAAGGPSGRYPSLNYELKLQLRAILLGVRPCQYGSSFSSYFVHELDEEGGYIYCDGCKSDDKFMIQSEVRMGKATKFFVNSEYCKEHGYKSRDHFLSTEYEEMKNAYNRELDKENGQEHIFRVRFTPWVQQLLGLAEEQYSHDFPLRVVISSDEGSVETDGASSSEEIGEDSKEIETTKSFIETVTEDEEVNTDSTSVAVPYTSYYDRTLGFVNWIFNYMRGLFFT